MYIQHILEEVRIDAIDRFGKKIIVVLYIQDIKLQVVRDRSRLQRVSFILKDTLSIQEEGSDPSIGSGLSYKAHRSIRIDCGDPVPQLQ